MTTGWSSNIVCSSSSSITNNTNVHKRRVIALNQFCLDSSFHSPHLLLLEEMGNPGMEQRSFPGLQALSRWLCFRLRSLSLGHAGNRASTIPLPFALLLLFLPVGSWRCSGVVNIEFQSEQPWCCSWTSVSNKTDARLTWKNMISKMCLQDTQITHRGPCRKSQLTSL